MRIKKTFQGSLPENTVVNTQSDSQTNAYSCTYVNNMVKSSRDTNSSNTYSTTYINTSLSYSTSETKTGGIWINNKPIYKRTFSGAFANNQVLISKASNFIDCKGWLDPGTGIGRQVPYYEVYQGNSFYARLSFQNNQIKIDSYSNGQPNNCYGEITIYYTKTTD